MNKKYYFKFLKEFDLIYIWRSIKVEPSTTASLMDDTGSAQGLCCNTMKTSVVYPHAV